MLLDIDGRLPSARSGELSAEDSLKLANVGALKEMPRRARAAERGALAALGELLGVTLPPVIEDPLRRDQGIKLATWKAQLSRGVYHLVIQGDELTRQVVYGRDTEGEAIQMHAALPSEDGWQVAYEVLSGGGLYDVWEQPSASNGWRAVVRVDDEWSGRDNHTVLIIWAVPE